MIDQQYKNLESLLKRQSEQTIQLISRLDKDEQHRTEQIFLKSLSGDHAFTRRHNIRPAYEGTFKWVFPENENEAWSGLTKWLQYGDGVFWVTGKPGAGKSVFLKWLSLNDQTKSYLEEWRPIDPLSEFTLLSFCFWLADTTGMENTFRGFLFSLLHDLLRKDSNLLATLLDENQLREKTRANDWETTDLEVLLKYTIQSKASKTPICVFIDGLDECIEDDFPKLMAMIEDFMSHKNIKVCASGRPDRHHPILNSCPSLKLQDLTSDDIKLFVSMNLIHISESQDSTMENSLETRRSIIAEIVDRAQGIFLWVYVVVNSIKTRYPYFRHS